MRIARGLGIAVVASLLAGTTLGAPAVDPPDGVRSHALALQQALAGEPDPLLVADQVVVKLAASAVTRAAELPEYSLPQGIEPFDTTLARHGITEGHRLRRTFGTPIRDMALFRQLGLDRLYVLKLPQADAVSALLLVDELSGASWVEYAEPVYRHTPTLTPNDPLFVQQWPHDNTGQSPAFGTPDADMDSIEAWDINPGGANGTVAILDSGIQMAGNTVTHDDLAASVDLANSFDYVGNDPNPNDTGGHGTSVAGIAAAIGNNGVGVAGMCHNCRILVYKIGNTVHDSNAMMQAVDAGADTINMSHIFGGGCATWFQNLLDASTYAVGLGAQPVASAANSNGYGCVVPAGYPTVISAGGTDQFDNRIFTYSDYSEVAAAGTLAPSTALGNGYRQFSGTSASSPFIAGLGALLRSQRPDTTANQLRHIIRLGAEDQVGSPADPEGWDLEMGFGRINANNSMALLNSKWIALDRGHYHCKQDVTIAVQDIDGGATLDVTITGDIHEDVETVTLTRRAGSADYYEGTIGLNWVDADGAGGPGDGVLDVTHGENLTAADGLRTARAFTDCTKAICRSPVRLDEGDCDLDGAADPGEDRILRIHPANVQTEIFDGVTVTVTTSSPWVEVLNPVTHFGSINPTLVVEGLAVDAPRIRIKSGAPANTVATLDVDIFGNGWVTDDDACAALGWANDPITLNLNRDKGTATGVAFDFESGGPGFQSVPVHGTGALPECNENYVNPWNNSATGTRVHEGARAWGTRQPYFDLSDGALVSPAFTVPAGGGVLGWYHWIDAEWRNFGFNANITWDGMILEAKRTSDTTWTYVADANYNHELALNSCAAEFPFGAPGTPQLRMFSGDGDGTLLAADSYDQELLANLSDYAGDEIQVRWRFGSDVNTTATGAWIDTITLYNAYRADTWTGRAPKNLTGSDANCNASFDVQANALLGAGSYTWYRSTESCQDALQSDTPYATTAQPFLSDTMADPDVEYFYALGANESGPNACPSERRCIAGGCSCTTPPDDPTITDARIIGGDIRFTMQYAGGFADVYRDPNPDPAFWGDPLDTDIEDGTLLEPDFQYTDVNGAAAGSVQYYLFTGKRCGLTLPPR